MSSFCHYWLLLFKYFSYPRKFFNGVAAEVKLIYFLLLLLAFILDAEADFMLHVCVATMAILCAVGFVTLWGHDSHSSLAGPDSKRAEM